MAGNVKIEKNIILFLRNIDIFISISGQNIKNCNNIKVLYERSEDFKIQELL